MNNYYFFGSIERILSDKVRAFLEEGKETISFFRWCVPFSHFDLESAPPEKLDEIYRKCQGESAENELENLGQVYAASSAPAHSKALFIVIENLHFFAHSAGNPQAFYKQLVDACNVYSSQGNIHFILSGLKIPQAFFRENPNIEKWRFIDCADETAKAIAAIEKTHKDLFEEVNKFLPGLSARQLIRAFDFLNSEAGAQANSEAFKRFAEGLLETEVMLNTEVYAENEVPDKLGEFRGFTALEERLKAAIIGQDEAVQRFIDAVTISCSALMKKSTPRAVFLFAGPSGVGKTEICRQLKDFLPGYRFIQINLAEYNERAAVDKLIGIGRGYEDSELGGLLTEPVRCYPRHIILFDELDHSHASVIQLFYKIFEGEIMDGRGRQISFRDCFIIMTTNKGVVEKNLALSERRYAIERKLMEDTGAGNSEQVRFTEAFLGRIHSIIQFNTLSPDELALIAERYFRERVIAPYKEIGISVKISPSGDLPALAKEEILGIDSLFFETFALLAAKNTEQGARRLFQLMDEYLINPLELYRIKFQNSGTIAENIVLVFKPFFPEGLDYEETKILLIDDMPEEEQKLNKILAGINSINFTRNNFDKDNLSITGISMILLDLYKGEIDYGKDFLEEIKDKIGEIPVCIYSALPSGPKFDQLRSRLWQYGISAYISKDCKDIPGQIRRFVRRHYICEKAKSKTQIKCLELEPPVSSGLSLTFCLKWRI